MSQQSLHDLLLPHWERYKRGHRTAVREVHRSYMYESSAIQTYRFSQGVEWDVEERQMWNAALAEVLGPGYRLEWTGDAHHPACLINGVMMFT